MRYTYSLLGLLLLVGTAAGGYLAYNAKQHHSTIKWEYQRLTQQVLPNALSGGESTHQAKARLKVDLNTLTTEKTTRLDQVLTHADKMPRNTGPKPTRSEWLTGNHDTN